MKVFSSWSGGKESALATYKAILAGHEVLYLLNFLSEDGQRSRSHGIRSEVLALQAKAIGIPIIQVSASWADYEKIFKQTVVRLKGQGVKGGVFGDMDLEEHRRWVERVCDEIGIKPLFPLWGIRPEELFEEFLREGFEAVVVATRLREDLLGRKLDRDFLLEVQNLGSHPCGERGEYHTFVTDGLLFKKPVKLFKGEKRKVDGVWFLDIYVEV